MKATAIGSNPLHSFRNSFSQSILSLKAKQRFGPGYIQTATRLAIGLRCIPNDATGKTNFIRDHSSQVTDGNFFSSTTFSSRSKKCKPAVGIATSDRPCNSANIPRGCIRVAIELREGSQSYWSKTATFQKKIQLKREKKTHQMSFFSFPG